LIKQKNGVERLRLEKEFEDQLTREKVENEAESKAEADAKAKQQTAAAVSKPKTTTVQQPKQAQATNQPKTPQITVVNNGRPDIPMKYYFEYLKQVEDEIVAFCNQERAKEGLKPLVANDTLKLSARYKSNEMLQYNYFDHVSPVTNFNPWDIAKTFGYDYTAFGENIYMIQGPGKAEITAKRIFDGWMNSPGHKANIMSSKFGRIGVGVVFTANGNKCEATQQFSN
jgi:uncharacterized protein YkwD